MKLLRYGHYFVGSKPQEFISFFASHIKNFPSVEVNFFKTFTTKPISANNAYHYGEKSGTPKIRKINSFQFRSRITRTFMNAKIIIQNDCSKKYTHSSTEKKEVIDMQAKLLI